MGRSPLFWRLFGTFGLFWLASITVLGAIVIGRSETYFSGQLQDRLTARALLLRELTHGRRAADSEELQRQIERLDREIQTRITLIAADGTVWADSSVNPRLHPLDNHYQRPEVLEARRNAGGIGISQRWSTSVNEEMMYVAVRTDEPPDGIAFVRVALPMTAIREELTALRAVVLSVILGAVLINLAVAFWLAGRLAVPLGQLTKAARRLAAGDYSRKVHATGRDEIGTLARAFNDMSARLAEQFHQLEEDRQQLRAILGGMVEGVVALDAEQRILFANERAAQLLEFRRPDAVGRKLWQVVRRRAVQEAARRVLSGPSPSQEELSWSGPSPRDLTVHAACLPGDPPRGAVLVLHDTTELRRLERLRQEFVANVSHELKTPLAVIKACVETLVDGAVDDPNHRGNFLQTIEDQAERLHALILDLLSLARIEAGEEIFDFGSVPLEPAVAACMERHRARADARNQLLEAVGENRAPEPDAHQEVTAWADEEAVGQILDNLVDNAVKYTPPGGRIRVRWFASEGQVVLEVADNGIGIPEQDLPRIFERFYRVDKARSRELGGTGLGLSIVKHLVQAMKGTVRASSRVGEGTTFVVMLPRAPNP